MINLKQTINLPTANTTVTNQSPQDCLNTAFEYPPRRSNAPISCSFVIPAQCVVSYADAVRFRYIHNAAIMIPAIF